MYCIYAGINCLVVHFYDCIALLAIGLLCSLFHKVYCIINRHYICQLKECGL